MYSIKTAFGLWTYSSEKLIERKFSIMDPCFQIFDDFSKIEEKLRKLLLNLRSTNGASMELPRVLKTEIG